MSTIEEILSTYVKCFHFTNIVEIGTLDSILSSSQNYSDKFIHFLYINTIINKEDLKKTMELWDRKILQGGAIAFKGGIEEDIKEELKNNLIIKANYIYGTYFQQNLTILYKKFNNL